MRKMLAAAAVAALAVVPTAAFAQDGDAEVVAVHGIPQSVFDTLGADSTAVDVYAADSYDEPLTTFEFEDTGTLEVPAGTYTLEVYASGADPEAEDPVLELADAELAGGSSTSVVAHLDADGNPVLAAYGNQTDGTGIQAFHTAQFGPVDIYADGEVALAGVANGDTARVDVPGGTTVPGVGIAPEGGDVALEVGDVEVPDSTLVLAYAIGSADDDSLTVTTATVAAAAGDDGDDDAATDDDADDGAADDDAEEGDTDEDGVPVPSRVDAGSGGAADTGLSGGVLALMMVGGLLVATPVAAKVRSRR
jgi:hypothetical protein